MGSYMQDLRDEEHQHAHFDTLARTDIGRIGEIVEGVVGGEAGVDRR